MTKKLDDELRQAIGGDDGSPSAKDAEPISTRAVVKAPAAPPRSRKSLGLLVTLLAMVGAVVALVLVGIKDAAVYAMPVDQLVSAGSKYVGRKVRIDGELVPGTLVKRDMPCEYRFTIHGKEELPVRYSQCVIPDTFRDVPGGGVQVTVEGTYSADKSFEATLVMAKCASKYDKDTHQMKDDSTAEQGAIN
jgi:cytochrome c-type biogenesis protein CcmE